MKRTFTIDVDIEGLDEFESVDDLERLVLRAGSEFQRRLLAELVELRDKVPQTQRIRQSATQTLDMFLQLVREGKPLEAIELVETSTTERRGDEALRQVDTLLRSHSLSGAIREAQGRLQNHTRKGRKRQVEHYRSTLAILEGMTEEAGAIPRGAAKSVYQLKVTLRDIKPPVWRRILVAGDIRLDKLHGILQWVMGWQNSHLHQFLIRGAAYGTPDPDFDLDVRDEKRMRLDQALADPGSKIVYEYDFGDGWTHDVLLEKILPPDRDTDYPVCIKGKRACPPEDCGGPWGYEELLQTLRDPAHPEHEDLLRWAGGQVDPDAFDLEETNAERDDYMQLLAEERGRFGY